MKCEFRVGDYVETVDNKFGYIDELWESKDDSRRYMRVVYTYGGEIDYEYTETGYGIDGVLSFQNNFRRIGKYNFTMKGRKLEPLEPLYRYEPIGREKILFEKVNEIIDYINKSDVSKGE